MLLEVRNIEAGYGSARILHGINIGFPAQSLTAIVGANGAGKTTLMRVIAGSIAPRSGSIFIDSVDVSRMPSHLRLGKGLALVPEGRSAFPDLTVIENLRLGGHTVTAAAEVNRRIEDLMELFPRLGERRSQAARTLSGGEQQMLVIARALMVRPRLLLLDEPSVGLAPLVVDQIFGIISNVRAAGTTVIIVEQNLGAAMEIADHAVVIEHGHVVLEGPASVLVTDDRVRSAYLGM